MAMTVLFLEKRGDFLNGVKNAVKLGPAKVHGTKKTNPASFCRKYKN